MPAPYSTGVVRDLTGGLVRDAERPGLRARTARRRRREDRRAGSLLDPDPASRFVSGRSSRRRVRRRQERPSPSRMPEGQVSSSRRASPSMQEEVSVTAVAGRDRVVDAADAAGERDRRTRRAAAREDGRRAGGDRGGRSARAADEPGDGRHLRSRPDRQQGQRVRRRRSLLDVRAARRRQHVHGSHRSRRCSSRSKSCAARTARSTAATRSAAAFSSCLALPSLAIANGPRFSGLFGAGGNSSDGGVDSNFTGSYGGSRVGVLGALAARHVGDIRVGGGVDSHAAVTRFLGVPSDVLMPDHLPDTGFNQYGGQVTVNWLPRSEQLLRRVVSARPPGRRQAVRSVARRRRQPDRRSAGPHARSVLSPLRTRRRSAGSIT